MQLRHEVSLDAADYAYQQCTLIVYVWAVVEWTGACRGYDRSHRHQTLVVDDDENSLSPWSKFTFSESDMTLTRCHSFLVLNPCSRSVLADELRQAFQEHELWKTLSCNSQLC